MTNAGDGVYWIVGSHSYPSPSPNAGPVSELATITLTDKGGGSATTTSTIEVGTLEAGVAATMSGWEFQDNDPYASASDFVVNGQTGVALINWGDGTSSLGTVTGGPGNGYGPVTLNIQGTHTYTQDSMSQPNGQYLITVTVTDNQGSSLAGTQTVSVVWPPMGGQGADLTSSANALLSNAVLAVFTDPDISDSASVFTANVNWGDGTPVDTRATVVGGNGTFEVLGSHTYTEEGVFSVNVQIFKNDPYYVWDSFGQVWVKQPNGPQIVGLSVIPGNSQYQYEVKLGPGQLRGGSVKWFVENVDHTATTNAKVVATSVVTNPPDQTELAADIQVANQPGAYIVGVQYTFNNATYFIWSAPIAVVQVNVSSPRSPVTVTVPTDKRREVRMNSAFLPGRPRDGGQLPIIGTPMQLIAAGTQAQPGLLWVARVNLQGPTIDGLKNVGADQIHYGFIQHVHVAQYRGVYQNQQELRASMEGRTYLDVATPDKTYIAWVADRDFKPPWYYANSWSYRDGFNYATNPLIVGADNPSPPVPLNYRLILPESDQEKRDASFLARTMLQLTFSLDVAAAPAATDDYPAGAVGAQQPRTGSYWQEGSVVWTFTGQGRETVVGPSYLLPPPSYLDSFSWMATRAQITLSSDQWQLPLSPSAENIGGPLANNELPTAF